MYFPCASRGVVLEKKKISLRKDCLLKKKISLRKALQLKKKLAGDVAKLNRNIAKFNAQRIVNPHVDVLLMTDEYNRKISELITLKTELAIANINIYEKIILAEELKSKIALYESLDTEETGEDYKNGELIPFNKTVIINYTEKENIIKQLNVLLEAALDAIDEYNSSHFIEVSVSE